MQLSAYPLIAAALGLALASPVAAQDTQAPEAAQTQPPDAGTQPGDAPDLTAPDLTAPVTVEPLPEAPAAEAPEGEAPAEAPEAAAPEGGAPDTAAPEEAAPDTGAAAPDAGAEAGAAAGADAAPDELREIVRDTFGAWEVRCLPDGADCFMYQLALDAEQNPVAEVSLLKLPAGGEAVAGATVVTPLGTLLTEGVVMQIDGGERRSYPFNWCSQVGCFARFGLNDPAIGTMKGGREAAMTVISVGAPEAPITVPVSLDGFTAAYDSLAAPE